jgi:hypothetical protein
MPSSTDPDHFQRNFLVNILARYGTAETANSLAYSLPQLTTVFHALAVSPGRVMAQDFVAAAHDGNSRAESVPRLLAYFLLRMFHLHASHMRVNSIRLPASYRPGPSPDSSGAREVMVRCIGTHASTAAKQLVVAIFMLVDFETAIALSSYSQGCLVEVIMAMATGAGDHGLEEPTSEWISLLPNAVVQALQTHLPGVRIKSTFRVANSEANSFALEWWEQPTCAKLGKLLFHVATAGDSYERSGGNGLWMNALLAPARVCKQWTESMAIHLYVLCRELNVGYQAPEELVVLNDLTCASNLSPIMQRVSELIAVEGSLCEWSNAVLLALKQEQYVRAEDGYDLRTAYARDVTVKLDSIVRGTTSSVEKLLLLVCAVAYDSSKQSDMVSCIQLLDQEPQVTARNKLPSKKNKTAAPAVASGEISAAGDNHGTAMSRADNNIQPASEADHTAGKAPPLKKTKNSPDLIPGARAAGGGGSSVVDMLSRGTQPALKVPAAAVIRAAAAAVPGTKLGRINKRKAKKGKNGKIAGFTGMTNEKEKKIKEEKKKTEVEALKSLTEDLSVLMRLPPDAQVEAAVDACDKCLTSCNSRSVEELSYRDQQVKLFCAYHAGNNVAGKCIGFLEGKKSNMPAEWSAWRIAHGGVFSAHRPA